MDGFNANTNSITGLLRGTRLADCSTGSRNGAQNESCPPIEDNNSHREHTDHETTLSLYRSYCRCCRRGSDPEYEATVRGWLYQPHVNRKGKLMMAAIERLVGVPAPAQAASFSSSPEKPHEEPLINLDETPRREDQLSGWMNLRPPLIRATSSFLRGSRSRTSSRTASRAGSKDTSPERGSKTHGTFDLKRVNEALESSYSIRLKPDQSQGEVDDARTSSRTFSDKTPPQHKKSETECTPEILVSAPESSSSSSSKVDTSREYNGERPKAETGADEMDSGVNSSISDARHTAHISTKAARQLLRDRLSAVAHRSLTMREVCVVIYARDDERQRWKRLFYTRTDDSGKFSLQCRVPFVPGRVRVISSGASAETDLLPMTESGVSVISDIDDTIRLTGVTKSKREILQNVLVKTYDQVKLDGVSEWYNQLKMQGAQFHYVSNSPWQLYDTILGFLRHHNFPDGSIHLKKYQGLMEGFLEQPQERKRAVLEAILQDFPQRKFILVGDSGEADLEAYGDLAKRFPRQILAIYIRDITLPPHEPLLPFVQTSEEDDLIEMGSASKTPTPRLSFDSSSSNSKAESGSPPPLPRRPGMVRRASSRLHLGTLTSQSNGGGGGVAGAFMGAVSSASSVVGSAAQHAASKLLTTPPALPLRPGGPAGSSHSRSRSLPLSSHEYESRSRASSRSFSPSHSRSGSQSRSRPVSPDLNESDFQVRVDKRVESWKNRMHLHHRMLSPEIHLRTWRVPDDVKEDSLKLVREERYPGDPTSLI